VFRNSEQIERRAIPVAESNFSGGFGLRRQQAHQGERSEGFAGAGFADQPQNLAARDGEAEVADGGRGRPRPPILRAELDGETADIEQGRHRCILAGAFSQCLDAATANLAKPLSSKVSEDIFTSRDRPVEAGGGAASAKIACKPHRQRAGGSKLSGRLHHLVVTGLWTSCTRLRDKQIE